MNDFESLAERVSASVFAHVESCGYDDVSEGERFFTLVFEFHHEVCNGGFAQYFLNSSGVFALEAVSVLESTGFALSSHLLQKALELGGFPDGFDFDDWRVRQPFVCEIEDRDKELFTVLETEYYESRDCIDFWNILSRYVETNRIEFPCLRDIS